jgi:acetyl esterase/lipase
MLARPPEPTKRHDFHRVETRVADGRAESLIVLCSLRQGGPVPTPLSYAPAEPAGSLGHLLDLYLPESAEPAPAVLWSRGSGWMRDNGRERADELAAHLVPLGFAVAGVSIRSSSQATFPAQLHDIKSAIRWLRAHAEEYRLDPRRFGIAGDSSGGWTAAMAGLTGGEGGAEGDVGVSGLSSAVQAVVCFYPPTDFLEMDAHMPDGCTAFNRMVGTTDCHRDPGSPDLSHMSEGGTNPGCPIG